MNPDNTVLNVCRGDVITSCLIIKRKGKKGTMVSDPTISYAAKCIGQRETQAVMDSKFIS